MTNKIETDWSFQEPELWSNLINYNSGSRAFPKCSLMQQSPININTDLLINCDALCELKIKPNTSKCRVQLKNNLLKFRYDPNSFIEYKGSLYSLTEISVHTPSLHTIDGQKYDMEILLIHSLSGSSNDNEEDSNVTTPMDNGVIISCLYQKGEHHGPTERFFNEVINELPSESINYHKSINVSNNWGVGMLLPRKKSFYSYTGSLPYPPCTQYYTYLVMEEIGNIGETNFEMLKLNLGKNIRPIQPLNDREVFYNNDTKTILPDTESNIDKVTDDRFLKCVKKVTKKNKKKQVIVKKKNKNKNKGLSQKTIDRAKSILFTTSMLLMFTTAIFFVKFLYYRLDKKDQVIKPSMIQVILMTITGSPDAWIDSAGEKWSYPEKDGQCPEIK